MKVAQVLLFAGEFHWMQRPRNYCGLKIQATLIFCGDSYCILSCQRCRRWASQICSKASSTRGKIILK